MGSYEPNDTAAAQAPVAAAAAAAPPKRIAATAARPEPLPPCGGRWARAADGSLVPQDAAAAAEAGLTWDPVDAAAAIVNASEE